MSAVQRLAKGKTVNEKYAHLGLSGKPVHPRSPKSIFGMVVGRPGHGKTTLFCDCPDCLIINTDLSSIPIEDPESFRAVVWPYLGEGGEVLGSGGRPLTLTWDAVLTLQKQLLEEKAAGKPVPNIIALDTISSALDLLKEWTAKRHRKESFKDLHGQQAYDEIYTELVDFALRFRSAGFGFYYITHVVDDKIPIGDDRYTVKPQLRISNSLWGRINWRLELVAALARKEEREEYIHEQEAQVGGRTVVRKIPKERTITKVILSTTIHALDGITKSRRQLDDIELTPPHPWDCFEKVFTSQPDSES